uniref:Immunoglobulin I-set domain-containing protein n=1 Tax=Leptobrachium leishanense TaxID=445787 RepID=A0A8C5PT31_9ANUR
TQSTFCSGRIYHFLFSVSVKATEIMAAEGESVTFQPDFSGPRTEVVWKNGEDKLVELNQNYSHYYHLADRASASFHSGSLTIRELVESDSGHYSGNILTEGKYHETRFTLKVSRKYQIRTIYVKMLSIEGAPGRTSAPCGIEVWPSSGGGRHLGWRLHPWVPPHCLTSSCIA